MTQLSVVKPNAQQWRAVGSEQAFPILAESRLRIKHQLHNKTVSFEDLAHSVELDPALCLHLQLAVARQRPHSLEQVSGAASCLSLLGMEELVRLMKQLPVVAADTSDQALQIYRRALLTAQLAGVLAADWAPVLGSTSPQYARWSTMLASAPLWLWLLNYPQAQNWLHLLSAGQDLIPAARQVFGKADKEWQQLARLLHLPAMAAALFNPLHWPDRRQWRTLRRIDPRDSSHQRELMHRCHQPAMLPLMANALAWHWHIAPDSRRTRRWQTLIAHWLGRSGFVLQPHLRQLQIKVTHLQHSSEGTGLHLLVSPQITAQPYAWINPAGQEETSPVKQQVPVSATPPATEINRTIADEPAGERHNDSVYMKKLLRQLQQEPDSFGDLHYLMRGMLKGVCAGLGMPSACIALLNRERTALKVFYTEGLSEQAPIRRFLIDLREPTLFSKLMEKQSAVLLTPENRVRYLTHIPPAMASLLPGNCMMMSIDAGAQPIGLVMAFGSTRQAPLSQAEFIEFKNLCIVTCQGLTALRLSTEKQRQRKDVRGA